MTRRAIRRLLLAFGVLSLLPVLASAQMERFTLQLQEMLPDPSAEPDYDLLEDAFLLPSARVDLSIEVRALDNGGGIVVAVDVSELGSFRFLRGYRHFVMRGETLRFRSPHSLEQELRVSISIAENGEKAVVETLRYDHDGIAAASRFIAPVRAAGD